MAVLVEVVLAWVVASVVVALVVGGLIARAGRMAELRESYLELVPDLPPAPRSGPAGPGGALGASTTSPQPALGAVPGPTAPLDDVVHLRLTLPER